MMGIYVRLGAGACVLAALLLTITACGGGSTGGPTATETPAPATPVPTPADPTPGGGTPPDTPGETEDPAPTPPSPGDPGGEEEPPSPVPPAPPAPPPPQPLPPLPAFDGFEDVKAVAADAITGVLYAIRSSTGELYEWAPDAETPVLRGPLGQLGIQALAYTQSTQRLLATAMEEGASECDLLSVDVQTLLVERLGTLPTIEGLAFRTKDDRLYGVSTADDTLVQIDPNTLEISTVGPLGTDVGHVAGLAYDEQDDVFYGTDVQHGVLVAIDPATGAAEKRATLETAVYEGLAFRKDTRTFLASAARDGRLDVIDPMGSRYDTAGIPGLAFDPEQGVIYGSHVGSGMILAIDPDTGWKREIGSVAVAALEGLAWDASAGRLFGLSSATQILYAIRLAGPVPEVATIGRVQTPDGARSWASLTGLAHTPNGLRAVDTNERVLLRIDPNTAEGIVLAPIPEHGGVQSLAFDAESGLLHAFSDEAKSHLVIDPGSGFEIRPGEAGRFDAIGGLAWDSVAKRLLGTELVLGELVEVYAAPREGPTRADTHALAFAPGTEELRGFDRETRRLVSIDRDTGMAEALSEAIGGQIDAMARDVDGDLLYAFDSQAGSLYAVAADHQLTVIGGEGRFAPHALVALAWVPDEALLFGVDAHTHRLVRIDAEHGIVEPAPSAWTELPYVSIEAMSFDADSGRLVAVDRETRTLLEIDPATGVATAIAVLEFDAISAAAVLSATQEVYVVETANGALGIVDRYTGETLEPPMPITRQRGHALLAVATAWWPRGEVRPASLDTLALTVSLDYEDDGDLVFRRGDEELYRAPFRPERKVTVLEIPEAVREQLTVGDVITWGIDRPSKEDLFTEVTVVDRPAADTEIATLAENAYLKAQPDRVQSVRRGRILLKQGLFAEALPYFLTLEAAKPGDPLVQRALLTATRGLGIEDARFADVVEVADVLGK